jgi:hypothetical protein
VSVCSVRFSQQTATVSPHSITRLVSVVETYCISCEVRKESLLALLSSQISSFTRYEGRPFMDQIKTANVQLPAYISHSGK